MGQEHNVHGIPDYPRRPGHVWPYKEVSDGSVDIFIVPSRECYLLFPQLCQLFRGRVIVITEIESSVGCICISKEFRVLRIGFSNAADVDDVFFEILQENGIRFSKVRHTRISWTDCARPVYFGDAREESWLMSTRPGLKGSI